MSSTRRQEADVGGARFARLEASRQARLERKEEELEAVLVVVFDSLGTV